MGDVYSTFRSSTMDKLNLLKRHLPLGSVVFLVYTIVWFSSNSIKPYWTDEIFSIWTSGAGRLSWVESFGQISSGRDGMMPAFYILSTGWEKFLSSFGIPPMGVEGPANEIWLRIPALGWTLFGFGVLFLFLKRKYGAAGAGIGISVGMLCTVGAGQEMQWVRAYAPMVSLVSLLVVLAGLRSGNVRTVLLYLTCLALTLVHPYGFLYAGAVVGVVGGVDLFRRRSQSGVVTWGAMVLPFVIILWNFNRLIKVKHLGGEGGMWPTPGLDSLLFSLAPLSSPLIVAFVLIFGGVVFVRGGAGGSGGEEELDEGSRLAVRDQDERFGWGVLSLGLVPLFIWIFSQWDSFFIIRYFSPSIVLVTVLVSWCCSKIMGRHTGWISALSVGVICWVYLSQGLVTGADRVVKMASHNDLKGLNDNRFLKSEDGTVSPLVIEDLDLFLPRMFYNFQDNYFFPVRELDPAEPGFRDKALAQNLVLAHGGSYAETEGRVGINPSSILNRAGVERLIEDHRRIFMLVNRRKGTGQFVGEELEKRGWKATVIIPDFLIMWENAPDPKRVGGESNLNLWYGSEWP